MTQIYGFGAERLDPPNGASRATLIERSRKMLSRAINLQTLVAFTGSGCSAALGYPNWKEFTRSVIHATLTELRKQNRKDDSIGRLESIATRLDTRKEHATRDYLFYLSYCQRMAWTLPDQGIRFYEEYIKQTFGPDGRSRDSNNPYDALLALPIHRFVTSNYDMELEVALEKNRRIPIAEFGVSELPSDTHRSFTQKPDYYKQIAGFAVAGVPSMRDAVFHCHGRFDDADSIVATEHDYQKWYLVPEDAEGGAFRQSIDLLFGSNPILFVGFSMADEDLMRPLRMFTAANHHSKHSRLLFALVDEGDDESERDQHDLLFERYGVHVIPFPRPGPKENWGKAYCEQLRKIKEDWTEHARLWLEKPAIRKVCVPVKPPAPYQHYAPKLTEELAPKRLARDQKELIEKLESPACRIVVITGSGGTGKSWRALQLLQHYVRQDRKEAQEDKKTGRFFWSSYYTDDWLTGLDRALRYLETEPASGHRRTERLRQCLSKEHLLILDGFERLLRTTPEVNIGAVEHQGVKGLLETAGHGKAKIVITSRLMLDVLRPHLKSGTVHEIQVQKLTAADLEESGMYAALRKAGKLDRKDLSSICALCEGHSYALVLVAVYLQHGDSTTRVREVQTKLAAISPTHRLPTVIDIVVNDVNRRSRGVARPLLERIAIFMSPVTRRTLEICYEQAIEGRGPAPSLDDTLNLLLEARLVFHVSTEPPAVPEQRSYTVHPTVRGYVFNALHHAGSEALPNFTLAGYTSGNAAVSPGSPEAARSIEKLFTTLVDRAEEAGQSAVGRELCRSAWGVLRSRFEANTATRWGCYGDYIRHGIRMAMVAKTVSPHMWSYVDRNDTAISEHTDGPLYADELAWLYSDVGLAIYSEGNMADTYAVWELSYEIDRVTDNEEESGQYIVQSRLHMAGVYLELGKLATAEEYLSLCEKANQGYGDPDYAARVRGYRGVLQHLRADTAAADRSYEHAVKKLVRAGRNLRAISIFQRHWAALKAADKSKDEAWRLARASRTAAEEGRYADLIGYARSMQGHIAREAGDYLEAQHDFEAAIAISRKYGVRRLECEVLCEMSRLALALGDWETARSRAVSSLMIANELSLGLRRTHGLLMLGLATVKAGKPGLGAAYLRHAYRLAAEQHYRLRMREADRELRLLGEPPPPDFL
jgi:tetratricopeptide (TPR) repeat protein